MMQMMLQQLLKGAECGDDGETISASGSRRHAIVYAVETGGDDDPQCLES